MQATIRFFPLQSGGVAGRWACSGVAFLGCVLLLTAGSLADDPEVPGSELYRMICARCHGAHGEGVKDEYSEPLQGAHALADLIRIVDETMPEDDPDKCTGESAAKVARYIYETFYAAEAQARQARARIELARLTVRQYDNAIADLLGTFTGEGKLDDQRGLKARYYNDRGFRRDKMVLERTDPQVSFDFGESSPDTEKIGNEEFAMQWQGGIFADETGDFEFCVTTQNGVKLWVNDNEEPLIDAWVVSGDDTEHRATVRLLGGRVYPIRIDYFKSKQQKTASVTLTWQPPHRAEEIVPERNLSPSWFPPTYVVKTTFPPDDSSVGYERGTTVSKSWDEAKTYAAIEVTNAAVKNLVALAKAKEDAPDRLARIREFCHRFAERAFRRPLDDEQRTFFVDQHFASDSADPVQAAKKSLLLVLLSPRFLYLGWDGKQLDDYDVASRISFGLWDSLPDAALLEAAKNGQLRTPEQVANQARRMLPNFRTKAKMRYFLHSWLNIDHRDDISKDKELFREFDAGTASSLRASLDLFLDDVIWSDTSDFRQLLLADYLFVNASLAKCYGYHADAGGTFQRITCEPQQYAGILTHPYLMARYAYHKSSSPIHRGVFVVRSLLGRFLKPPPIAVAPTDEGLSPNLTTRQRVAQQTSEPVCQTCHSMINALGFSFEHYDAVGKFRTIEKDQPIDASGSYTNLAGDVVSFNGARELAEFLAGSEETHRCFIEQLFHQVVKQPALAYGSDTGSNLQKSFSESGFNVQELLVEILKASALRTNQE